MTAELRTDPAPPGEEAPDTTMPGVPAPAEGVVQAVADVRGEAAAPASGRAQVRPPHAADADGVLRPPVVRAVAAVPGALSVPRPPPAWPPIPLAPPGLPGRPPTEKRRAFAIHPHDFFGDAAPPAERHIGRAALPPPAPGAEQGIGAVPDPSLGAAAGEAHSPQPDPEAAAGDEPPRLRPGAPDAAVAHSQGAGGRPPPDVRPRDQRHLNGQPEATPPAEEQLQVKGPPAARPRAEGQLRVEGLPAAGPRAEGQLRVEGLPAAGPRADGQLNVNGRPAASPCADDQVNQDGPPAANARTGGQARRDDRDAPGVPVGGQVRRGRQADGSARVNDQAAASAGLDGRIRSEGRARGGRADGPFGRPGRPAAGALVELRRPRQHDEQERGGEGGGLGLEGSRAGVDGSGRGERSKGGGRGLDGSGRGARGLDRSGRGEQRLDGSGRGAPGLDGSGRGAQGVDGSGRGAQGVGERKHGGPGRGELEGREQEGGHWERREHGNDGVRGGDDYASDGSGGGGGELLRVAVPKTDAGPAGEERPTDGQPEGGGNGPDPVRKKRLRQTALPIVAAGVAAFVVGTGYLAVSDRGGGSDLGRWGPEAVAAPVVVGGRSGDDPFGAATAAPVGAPGRLRVKAIGIDTPLEKLHLGAGGALVPPKEYGRAGWYSGGTAPGDLGPAVIAGHVDSKSGPAIFYRLRELTVGDRIEVVRGGSVVRFTVVREAWYPKTHFPTGEVYGPTPDRQLRLITCGGVFDHRLRSYKDNFVVYAVAG